MRTMPAVELPPPHLPPRVPGALRRIPPRLHTPGHCTAAPQHLRSTSSTAGHQPAAHRPGDNLEHKMGDLRMVAQVTQAAAEHGSWLRACSEAMCHVVSAADCGGAGVRVCIWAPEHAEQNVRGQSSSGHTGRWRRRRRQDAGSRVLVRPGFTSTNTCPSTAGPTSPNGPPARPGRRRRRRVLYCVNWLTRFTCDCGTTVARCNAIFGWVHARVHPRRCSERRARVSTGRWSTGRRCSRRAASRTPHLVALRLLVTVLQCEIGCTGCSDTTCISRTIGGHVRFRRAPFLSSARC